MTEKMMAINREIQSRCDHAQLAQRGVHDGNHDEEVVALSVGGLCPVDCLDKRNYGKLVCL